MAKQFPRWLPGVLGLIELLFALAIIGLEIGSIYIDLAHGTIWIGLWAGLVYLLLFGKMMCLTCCCRGRYFATYVLVWNIIGVALACVLIYFTQYFMSNLCACYLGDALCCAIGGIPSLSSSNYTTTLNNCQTAVSNGYGSQVRCQTKPTSKLTLIEAQLACSIGMLITCLTYIVAYFLSCFGICLKGD